MMKWFYRVSVAARQEASCFRAMPSDEKQSFQRKGRVWFISTKDGVQEQDASERG